MVSIETITMRREYDRRERIARVETLVFIVSKDVERRSMRVAMPYFKRSGRAQKGFYLGGKVKFMNELLNAVECRRAF